MGNCWARFEEWLCPNPWSGYVIQKLNYQYSVRSVSIDDLYNSVLAQSPPARPPLSQTISAVVSVPQPHPKTQPLPSPKLEAISPTLKPMEDMPLPEQKIPLLTASSPMAPPQPKHYNSIPSTSPLILTGRPPTPAPPPLSLLAITMQKPIYIEHD